MTARYQLFSVCWQQPSEIDTIIIATFQIGKLKSVPGKKLTNDEIGNQTQKFCL